MITRRDVLRLIPAPIVAMVMRSQPTSAIDATVDGYPLWWLRKQIAVANGKLPPFRVIRGESAVEPMTYEFYARDTGYDDRSGLTQRRQYGVVIFCHSVEGGFEPFRVEPNLDSLRSLWIAS